MVVSTYENIIADYRRMYKELFEQSNILLDKLKATKEKCKLQEDLIESQKEQIKFLSDYIENGGTKFYDDC